jgi:hypothetical protein
MAQKANRGKEAWRALRLALDRRNIDHYGHGLPLLFFLARYRKMCLIMPWPWKCESLRVPVHVNVLRTSKLNEPFRSSMRREHASPNPFSTGRKGWTREMIHEAARRRRTRSSASAATATFSAWFLVLILHKGAKKKWLFIVNSSQKLAPLAVLHTGESHYGRAS